MMGFHRKNNKKAPQEQEPSPLREIRKGFEVPFEFETGSVNQKFFIIYDRLLRLEALYLNGKYRSQSSVVQLPEVNLKTPYQGRVYTWKLAMSFGFNPKTKSYAVGHSSTITLDNGGLSIERFADTLHHSAAQNRYHEIDDSDLASRLQDFEYISRVYVEQLEMGSPNLSMDRDKAATPRVRNKYAGGIIDLAVNELINDCLVSESEASNEAGKVT